MSQPAATAGTGAADSAGNPYALPPSKLKGQSPDQQQSIIFMFLAALEKSLAPLTTVRLPLLHSSLFNLIDPPFLCVPSPMQPEMKASQPVIEKQLLEFVNQHKVGAPARRLIARCFQLVYKRGDSRTLVDNITGFLNIAKAPAKSSDSASRL